MKPLNSTIKKRLAMFLFLSASLLLFPLQAAAASDTESILNQFPLESNRIYSNVIRSIGWAIVNFLHWLVDEMESGIYSINDVIGGFFTSDAVLKLEQNKVFPLAAALLTLVILFIGLVSMFKPLNFTSIIQNFVIGVVVFLALPYLLSSAYSFTTQAATFLRSNDSGSSIQTMSDRILVDNITDTTRYDAEGFKNTNLKYKSYFAISGADTSKISSIDIDELVNPDDMKYPDVWKNSISTAEDGSTSLQELNSGQFGFINIPVFSNYYYRWNVDWFTIFSTLLVTAAALLLSGVKIARLIYELAINQTMAQVMALLDIYTAQRLKKCIQLLISTLGTLFAIFFMLQMYILGTAFVSEQSGLKPIVKFFVEIALAFAVVDGPNLFEQIFGIDAGIKSGMRTLYGLKAAGSLVSGGVALAGGRAALEAFRAKGVMGAARGIFSRAGGVAGGVGGAAAGAARGAAANHQRVSAVRNGFSASSAGASAEQVAGAGAGAAAGVAGAGAASVSGSHAKNTASTPKQSQSPPSDSVSSPPHESGHTASGAESIRQEPPIQSENVSSDEPDASTSSANTPKSGISSQPQATPPGSIGEYVRSKVSGRFHQSRPYNNTSRAYSLTRGTMDKHGDKKVAKAEQKMQRRPIQQSSKEEKQSSQATSPLRSSAKKAEQTWAEQELHSERESLNKKDDLS